MRVNAQTCWCARKQGTFVRVFPDTSSGRTDGVQAQLMANASEVQNVYVGLEVTIIAGAGFLDLCLPSLCVATPLSRGTVAIVMICAGGAAFSAATAAPPSGPTGVQGPDQLDEVDGAGPDLPATRGRETLLPC